MAGNWGEDPENLVQHFLPKVGNDFALSVPHLFFPTMPQPRPHFVNWKRFSENKSFQDNDQKHCNSVIFDFVFLYACMSFTNKTKRDEMLTTYKSKISKINLIQAMDIVNLQTLKVKLKRKLYLLFFLITKFWVVFIYFQTLNEDLIECSLSKFEWFIRIRQYLMSLPIYFKWGWFKFYCIHYRFSQVSLW